MIATSQTLASAAGLNVLQHGGNAIDAVVTAAAVLAVIEPSMNGIGGDLLAIVYDAKTKKIYGLDSTGRSAYAATPEEFARRGITEMPGSGPLSVDVPGVVEGWHQLLTRFGTISLARAIAPAIPYARDGFPVAELMANEWKDNEPRLAADPATAATFLPAGKPPQARRDLRQPAAGAHARADRHGRPRRVLRRARSRARSSPTSRRGTACSTCATSPITRPTGSSRSAPPIAATT